jgi:hypothetical protein
MKYTETVLIGEQASMWKEVMMVCFKVLSRNYPAVTDEDQVWTH